MEPSTPSANEVRKYLLGLLPEEDGQALEDRYFGDPKLLDAIDTGERELIQAYLADQLSEEETRAFESHFLRSGAARRKVEEARVVIEYFRRSGRRSRTMQIAVAAVVLLTAGVTAFLVLDVQRGRVDPNPTPRNPVSTPDWRAAYTIAPGRQRSAANIAVIQLPNNIALLELKLEMDHECLPGQCRAELTINTRQPPLGIPVLGPPNGPRIEIPTSYLPDRTDCLLEIWAGGEKVESFQLSLNKTSPASSTP